MNRVSGVLLAAAALLFTSLAPGLARAGDNDGLFDPLVNWRILETEHFRLYYDARYEDEARRFLFIAEDVHTRLSPLLQWTPSLKLDITLMDAGDDANGFSQTYPNLRIVFYSSPPDSRSTLNDYDDWRRVLIAHEYTHTLHLDNKSGVPAIINYVFGRMYNPNMASPHFMSEGFAIHSESRETDGGRERSALYDMYLRADVLDGRFLTLDQMSNTPSSWPWGTAWYLYGSSFMQYLADRFGEDIFASIAYLYGRRIVPYGLNRVMKEVTGYDYPALYADWKRFLEDRYRRQKETIERQPLTEGELMTHSGGDQDWLQATPDGRAAVYFSSDATKRPGWWRLDLATGEERLLLGMGNSGGGRLSADGRELIVSTTRVVRGRYSLHDIFSYDLETKSLTRLTEDQRAVMPAVSPDNRHVAYVSYSYGRTRLMVFDRHFSTYAAPLPEGRFDQIFDPVFTADGAAVIFSAHRRGGRRDLWQVDLATRVVTQLTDDRSLELNPVVSPDGRFLYYSSDISGVYNVYRRDLASGETVRVSNVLSGAFSPAPLTDGSGFLFVAYDPKGYQVRRHLFPPRWQPPAAPAADLRGRPAPRETAAAPVIEGPKPYSPFPGIYPHIWTPTFGQDYAGSTVGVHLEGSDPTLSHYWSMELDYGVYSHKPSFAAGYSNSWYPIRFNLSASHSSHRLRNAATKDGKKVDFNEAFYYFGGGLSYTFGSEDRHAARAEYAHSISMGYRLSYSRAVSAFEFDPAEGEFSAPDTGLNAGLSLSWSYSNYDYEPMTIGASWGRGLGLAASLNHRVLGSQYNSLQLAASAAYYVRIPGTETHSLAFRFLGGMAIGDFLNRQFFYFGGPPEVNIVSDLIYNNRQYGVIVRGYPPYSIAGDRYVLFNNEYRAQLWQIDRGFATYPLYFSRLHAAVFADVINAWGERFEITDTKVGVGAELRLDIIVGYFITATVRGGYARGLMSPNDNRVFFVLDNLY